MKHRENDYKRQLTEKARQLAGAASYERQKKTKPGKDPRFFDPKDLGADVVFGDIERRKGEGRTVETFPLVEQFKQDHQNIFGKVATLLLCLFAFTASAQVFVSAPGYVVFQYGRDTVDTAALPAFFAVLGDDAKTAEKRTAEIIPVFNRGVDVVDYRMQATLQGIGLREYVWFRGFLIAVEETRNDNKAKQRK